MAHVHGEMAKEVAKHGVGMAATAAAHQSGRGLLHGLAKHPLLVLGLGIAAGYLIHKYRREIVSSATRLSETGKDFIQQQRENLEDVLSGSGTETEQEQ